MNPSVGDFKIQSEKIINSLKEDLKTIRTGRATPALLENLEVEAYGGSTRMKLSSLSSISTQGPTMLQVRPFDPSILQDVEKAILKSSLGLSPKVQGQEILVSIPPLSEEQREKFAKLVGQKIEERRVMIRGARDEVRRKIRTALDRKEITEDDKFRQEKEIDNIAQKSMEEMQRLKENKESEIRQI